MSDPTREEFDAKLGMIEARLDAKLAGIDGKIDRLFDHVESSKSASNEAKSAANRAEDAARAALSATNNVKWNILITAIAVTGVLFAMGAIWVQGVEMVGTLLGALSNDQ